MSEDTESKDETKIRKKRRNNRDRFRNTFSCCGIWREKMEICPDENGLRFSPSIVCIRDNETLIGESAYNV